MNFSIHILSFTISVLGLLLLFIGIYFVNNTKYDFMPPICTISGVVLFFGSFIIFEHEPQKIKTITESTLSREI
jgi:uncharacterized membrane protein YqgA involved in biofilm formation